MAKVALNTRTDEQIAMLAKKNKNLEDELAVSKKKNEELELLDQ